MTETTAKERKAIGSKILQYMTSQKMKITAYNIVYIEGVDPVEEGFPLNADIMDFWNDTRNVIRDDGDIVLSAIATTEPGFYYTRRPMNREGAARIAFGQYLDCWEINIHGVGYPHEALCQIAPVTFYRDLNQDGYRTGDRVFKDTIGLNQHTTSNAPPSIEMWSAGCLVGRYPSTHQKFIRMMKDTGKRTFSTTVLDGSELHKLGVL